METTDKELLQRIADKDERAFNELYRRYSRLFLSWVYSRLHDRETTRDVVQEFWEEIWSRPDRFHCDEKGSAKKIFIQFLAFRAINYVKSSLGRSLGSEILLAEAEVSRSYDHSSLSNIPSPPFPASPAKSSICKRGNTLLSDKRLSPSVYPIKLYGTIIIAFS